MRYKWMAHQITIAWFGGCMQELYIREICKKHKMECGKITNIAGRFDLGVFNVDDRYVIRTSRNRMLDEEIKYDRIKALKHVPHLIHASEFMIDGNRIYYLILDYIQGLELLSVYNNLTPINIHDISMSISEFLNNLHRIKGNKYDIGHYIPIIPNHDKSWKVGHELYWDYVYNNVTGLQPDDGLVKLLKAADGYFKENVSSLDYEGGPVLLHNDFHFKNIIVKNNAFAGVIDWECSQYGEMDFELIHLLHWSLYPPSKDLNMTVMFNSVFREQMKSREIPMIEKRFTIYMLEHDFMQIVWSKGNKTDEYMPRIRSWLDGKLEEYVRNIM